MRSDACLTMAEEAVIEPTGAKPEKTGIKRIIANTGWLLGGKGFGGILSLFYLAILTRTLGVAGFGQFALITGTAQAIALIVTFQTWQVVIRFGARNIKGAENRQQFGRLVGLCTLLDIAGAVTGCILAYFAVGWLAPFFGWDDELAQNALIFALVMLLSIKSTPTGILRVENRFDLAAYAEAIIPTVRLIGTLIVWFTDPRLINFLAVWALSEVIHAIGYWLFAAWNSRDIMSPRNLFRVKRAARENRGIGEFLLISNLGSTLAGLSQNISLLIVGYFVGPTAAGLYRLASQLSVAMTKISVLLSRAIFAEVNLMRAQQGAEAMKVLFRKASRMLFMTGGTVILIVVAIGQPALFYMSGPEFLPAYPLLILLAAAASVDLAGAIYEPTLLSGSGARTALKLQATVAVLFITMLLVGLHFFGATGAAGAMLVAAIIRLVLFGVAARRNLAKG
ncbi:lipopolysaccharide biosynthesis protein [Sphingorhabdus sp. EL138]|uniref:lipopolysaccharide biosynthesis protein n=1 Tax=Sphingorhabdus sp. EL138 TaxID=2073156 RepID=UPI000D699FB4|nr:lipopolysaccharide biosynthesis protein [Sphingorhabdus sp. EL138]